MAGCTRQSPTHQHVKLYQAKPWCCLSSGGTDAYGHTTLHMCSVQMEKHIQKRQMSSSGRRGWRDGSAIKSTCCFSSRKHQLGSQHPNWTNHDHVTPEVLFFFSLGTLTHTHTHTEKLTNIWWGRRLERWPRNLGSGLGIYMVAQNYL